MICFWSHEGSLVEQGLELSLQVGETLPAHCREDSTSPGTVGSRLPTASNQPLNYQRNGAFCQKRGIFKLDHAEP